MHDSNTNKYIRKDTLKVDIFACGNVCGLAIFAIRHVEIFALRILVLYGGCLGSTRDSGSTK